MISPASNQRLAEQRRLLVAEVAGDGHAREVADPLAVDLRGPADLGQHRRRDADGVEQPRVPRERLEVHQHGPRGVGDIGDVPAAPDAARQGPDEPAVDGAEEQVAGLGGGPTLGAARLEDPGELERGRVRRDGEPGPRTEAVRTTGTRRCQPLARLGGPGVLPDDGVVDRAAGPTVPDDRGLALVADPDRGERTRVRAGLAQGHADAGADALDDLVRVVLDPAGSRGDLGVLQLVAGDDRPGPVEEDAAAARRPLVDGGDERARLHAGAFPDD